MNDEYVCHYTLPAGVVARSVYHANSLATAMAMHNESKPEYSDKVLRWVSPSGTNFWTHDSKLKLS